MTWTVSYGASRVASHGSDTVSSERKAHDQRSIILQAPRGAHGSTDSATRGRDSRRSTVFRAVGQAWKPRVAGHRPKELRRCRRRSEITDACFNADLSTGMPDPHRLSRNIRPNAQLKVTRRAGARRECGGWRPRFHSEPASEHSEKPARTT